MRLRKAAFEKHRDRQPKSGREKQSQQQGTGEEGGTPRIPGEAVQNRKAFPKKEGGRTHQDRCGAAQQIASQVQRTGCREPDRMQPSPAAEVAVEQREVRAHKRGLKLPAVQSRRPQHRHHTGDLPLGGFDCPGARAGESAGPKPLERGGRIQAQHGGEVFPVHNPLPEAVRQN